MNLYIFNNGIITAKGMSGSDRRVYYWSRIFKKGGQDITLIIPCLGKERFSDLRVKKYLINVGIFEKSGYFLTYLSRVIVACYNVNKFPRLEKDSVIYSSSDLIADSIPALFLKSKNRTVKLVCGIHLIALNPFKNNPNVHKAGYVQTLRESYYFLTQRIMISLLKHYGDLILVSNFPDKKFLMRSGFDEKKILVTYGAVDFSLIPTINIRKEFDAVWIGRLHRQKGIDDLFSIWERVLTKLPGAKLEVIAENNVKEYFIKSKYASKLNDSIVFTGYLNGKTLFENVKKAKLMLFPSYHESFGMAIAEAMACGLPVIAYDLPAYEKIWTKGIIKIPLGNIDLFAKEATALLNDGENRKALSCEAIKLSKNFSWEKTASEIINRLECL